MHLVCVERQASQRREQVLQLKVTCALHVTTACSLLELRKIHIESKKCEQKKDFGSVALDCPLCRKKKTGSFQEGGKQSFTADERSAITECRRGADEPGKH